MNDAYSTRALIRNLANFVRPYRGRFILASVLRVVSELIWLYPAYALAQVTTFFASYQVGQSLAPFWSIIVWLVVAVAAYQFAAYYSSIIGFPVAERASIDAQLQAIQHIFSVDIDWHEKENTGNKVKRIDRGGSGVNQLVRMWFMSFLEISVSLVGVLTVLIHFDVSVALFTVAFALIYLLVSIFYTRQAAGAKREENLKDEEMSGLVFESINNIRSVKVMSMAAPLTERIASLGRDLYLLIHDRVFWFQFGGNTKNLLGQVFRIGIMCFIAVGIYHGRYEVGFLILFYTYFSGLQGDVNRLAETLQDFSVKKQDVGRLIELLEIKPTTDIEEGKVLMPSNWREIKLEHVSFAYGEKKILDDVSFTITRGEKIGVVGLSGAGKSTLFKLLLKERESYTGEITVDGVPLRSISKRDYFTRAAVVLQETEVFNFPLRQNVIISNTAKGDDEAALQRALEIAHVNEFARSLPQGVDTMIGEKGVKLSGGEKQRVGVARAIYKDPELLLLDEATSHLDVESEEKIQDSLHQFFQSVTAVVIAHRLTTIKAMDKILVMENGRIIEQGDFASLYRQQGRFYELWEKQKL